MINIYNNLNQWENYEQKKEIITLVEYPNNHHHQYMIRFLFNTSVGLFQRGITLKTP